MQKSISVWKTSVRQTPIPRHKELKASESGQIKIAKMLPGV